MGTLFLLLTGGGPTDAPTLPADFVAALVAAFDADAELDAFEGLWTDEAPSGTTGTYAVVTLTGGSDVRWTDVTRIYDQTLRFRIHAPTADAATIAGDLLAERAKAWGALTFDGGFSLALRERGRRPAVKTKGLGPGAAPRYFHEFTASARVHQAL